MRDYTLPEPPPWRWKNLRSIGISVGFWPIEWGLGSYRLDDQFGGMISVSIGPFELTINYNDGSALSAKFK